MVKYAVICASNQNRSMEAHNVLKNKGLDVSSYGTGTRVRLPGPSKDEPNVYQFGKPYDEMYKELKEKDEQLYTRNGLLTMLDRNRNVKEAPQQWYSSKETYDVIITCEERCFDAVLKDLADRGEHYNKCIHVVNVNIEDDHRNAELGGKVILKLAELIEASNDIDADMDGIIQTFSRQSSKFPILYSAAYF